MLDYTLGLIFFLRLFVSFCMSYLTFSTAKLPGTQDMFDVNDIWVPLLLFNQLKTSYQYMLTYTGPPVLFLLCGILKHLVYVPTESSFNSNNYSLTILDPSLRHNLISISQQKEFKSFIITQLIFIHCALFSASAQYRLLLIGTVGVD